MDEDSLPSANGVVKNFTWQLTGVQPGALDPTNSACCYGATLDYLSTVDPLQGDTFKGTVVPFTLTPQEPLVDGSTGRTITFDDSLNDTGGFTRPYKTDIPLGVYALAATATVPNGTTFPVRLDPSTATWQPDSLSHNGISFLDIMVNVG